MSESAEDAARNLIRHWAPERADFSNDKISLRDIDGGLGYTDSGLGRLAVRLTLLMGAFGAPPTASGISEQEINEQDKDKTYIISNVASLLELFTTKLNQATQGKAPPLTIAHAFTAAMLGGSPFVEHAVRKSPAAKPRGKGKQSPKSRTMKAK